MLHAHAVEAAHGGHSDDSAAVGAAVGDVHYDEARVGAAVDGHYDEAAVPSPALSPCLLGICTWIMAGIGDISSELILPVEVERLERLWRCL